MGGVACFIDFTAAYDSVYFDAMWSVLYEEEFPGDYISIMKKLYANQRGRVRGQDDDQWFQILRGTKQGDPLSARIFSLVIAKLMAKLRSKWKASGFGVRLVDELILDAEYSDDVVIVSCTKEQI